MVNVNMVKRSITIFDYNSSIFSYLRYRQYLLFIYFMYIIFVMFVFVNVCFVYSTSNIVHIDYVGSSFFIEYMTHANSKLLSNLVISDLPSWYYFDSLLRLYDSYMLCMLYMSNVGEVSFTTYLMSYSFGTWLDTCYPCGGKSLPYFRFGVEKFAMLGMSFDAGITDFGSFLNRSYVGLHNNCVNAKVFLQSSPYVYNDGGVLRNKLLYTNTLYSIDTYLQSVIYCGVDSGFENLDSSPVFSVFSLNLDKFGHLPDVHRITSDFYFTTCFNFFSIAQLSDYTKYDDYMPTVVDDCVDNHIVHNYIHSDVSDSSLARNLYISVPEVNIQGLLRYGSVYDTISHTRHKLLLIRWINTYYLQNMGGPQLARLGWDETEFFHSMTLRSPRGFYDNYITMCDSSGSTYFRGRFELPNYYCSATKYCNPAMSTRFDIFSNYLEGLYGLYASEYYYHIRWASYVSKSHTNYDYSSIFNMGNYLNNVYLPVFTQYSALLNYSMNLSSPASLSSRSNLYIEYLWCSHICESTSVIAMYKYVFVSEYDVARRCTYDYLEHINTVYDYCSLNHMECTFLSLSPGITTYYGYGVHDIFLIHDNFSYTSKYSTTQVKNLVLLRNISNNLPYLLTSACTYMLGEYGIVIRVYLRILSITYPICFIILFIIIILHILYAYEFLLNDYVECMQFRLFVLYMCAALFFLYAYTSLFSLFLGDFYGASLIFSSMYIRYHTYDLFSPSDIHLVNLDEEFISLLLYMEYASISMCSSNASFSIFISILLIAYSYCHWVCGLVASSMDMFVLVCPAAVLDGLMTSVQYILMYVGWHIDILMVAYFDIALPFILALYGDVSSILSIVFKYITVLNYHILIILTVLGFVVTYVISVCALALRATLDIISAFTTNVVLLVALTKADAIHIACEYAGMFESILHMPISQALYMLMYGLLKHIWACGALYMLAVSISKKEYIKIGPWPAIFMLSTVSFFDTCSAYGTTNEIASTFLYILNMNIFLWYALYVLGASAYREERIGSNFIMGMLMVMVIFDMSYIYYAFLPGPTAEMVTGSFVVLYFLYFLGVSIYDRWHPTPIFSAFMFSVITIFNVYILDVFSVDLFTYPVVMVYTTTIICYILYFIGILVYNGRRRIGYEFIAFSLSIIAVYDIYFLALFHTPLPLLDMVMMDATVCYALYLIGMSIYRDERIKLIFVVCGLSVIIALNICYLGNIFVDAFYIFLMWALFASTMIYYASDLLGVTKEEFSAHGIPGIMLIIAALLDAFLFNYLSKYSICCLLPYDSMLFSAFDVSGLYLNSSELLLAANTIGWF